MCGLDGGSQNEAQASAWRRSAARFQTCCEASFAYLCKRKSKRKGHAREWYAVCPFLLDVSYTILVF